MARPETQCQGLSFFASFVTDLGPSFSFLLWVPGQLFYLPFRGTHFKAIIHPFARSKMRSIPIYLLFNRLFSILRSWQAIYFCLVGSLLLMRNAHFQTEKSKKKILKWVIYLPLHGKRSFWSVFRTHIGTRPQGGGEFCMCRRPHSRVVCQNFVPWSTLLSHLSSHQDFFSRLSRLQPSLSGASR